MANGLDPTSLVQHPLQEVVVIMISHGVLYFKTNILHHVDQTVKLSWKQRMIACFDTDYLNEIYSLWPTVSYKKF